MDVNQRIQEHNDFWTIMFGEETWSEIQKKVREKKPKNQEEVLGFLDNILEEEKGNRLTEISLFSDVEDTKPKPFPLEFWLFQTLNPTDETEKQVDEYRETFNKEIKSKLPCCTISASFGNYRNLENIKKKNNLICIDIDRFTKSKRKKSNICVDMQLAKEMFMQHPSTLYTGFSCSGDGIYAILKIADAEDLEGYFEYFRDKFAMIGLNIDESCKDYTRLRFFSVDKEGYFNPNAKAYKKPEKEKEIKKNTNSKEYKDNAQKVEKVCDEIEKHRIDITGSYDDWIKIGAGLFSEFADNGITYFHRISKFHPEYSIKKTEEKWAKCRRMNKTSLSSLFYIANSYGIRY